MRDRTYFTGHTIGWDWAGAYITGTKATRREIRRKLHRMADSFNPLAMGIYDGFQDRTEQRAAAIKAGKAPRTINPSKLANVLARA